MRNRLVAAIAALALVGVLVAASLVGAPALHAHGGGGGTHPPCIEHHADARYQGAGYTHVVVLESTCDRPVRCDVSTDVDPTPKHHVRVPSGETREVITRVGSPAYAVTETVDCELD